MERYGVGDIVKEKKSLFGQNTVSMREKGGPCYRPPKISVCDAYSQLVRVLSMFYPQVIHISGITYVNGVFMGFRDPEFYNFLWNGCGKQIYKI